MGFHLVLLCVLEFLPHELLCILFEVNHFKIYIPSYFYFKNLLKISFSSLCSDMHEHFMHFTLF